MPPFLFCFVCFSRSTKMWRSKGPACEMILKNINSEKHVCCKTILNLKRKTSVSRNKCLSWSKVRQVFQPVGIALVVQLIPVLQYGSVSSEHTPTYFLSLYYFWDYKLYILAPRLVLFWLYTQSWYFIASTLTSKSFHCLLFLWWKESLYHSALLLVLVLLLQ